MPLRWTQVQPAPFVVGDRYEIRDSPIGKGGMGVVYKAYDTITRRYVALKTISGPGSSTAFSLFEKEWSVLARLSHPNIVDILETGQFEENGEMKPFFVMPLLPGLTLDRLIKSDSHRLTVERTIEIITQTCRGLQVAHEQGLVHRDLKPSNIFVLDDDSVKIIDFGVVHLADVRTATGMKGTLQYVAPELLAGKPPSPLSDIFALAVVCYEALTGRKPFARPTEDETAEAIRSHIPPPASEINSAVNPLVSRTVHKAMAKLPLHRFSSAREFGEVLKKALRNEPIEYFDSSRIQPRIERVKKAQGDGDFQFARDVLNELEAEGHLDPQIPMLRVQLDQAIQQKTIRQLLENARTRIEEEEYPLAMQKIQEILEIDPHHLDALHMKSEVEKRRSEKQVDQWYQLVHQHIGNQHFSQARQGLEEILRLRPSDVQAHTLLAQVDQQEKESVNSRKEKEQLYESALQCYHQGEISTALDKLERVLALSRQSPGTENAEKEAQYQSLYKQIRSEREAFRNAYAEGRRHLEEKSFDKVLALCAEFLKKSPSDPLFLALKLETDERERQEVSAAVVDVGRRVDAEADLDRQISILKEATQRYPKEPHFQDNLKLIRERRDLVNSIVNRARQYEQRNQFGEALGQWDILRNIYRKYPGLDVEVERLTRRRDEQAREETKARWVRQIDQQLEGGDYEKAQALLREALAEFPSDRELASLEKLIAQGTEKRATAERHFEEGKNLCTNSDFDKGIAGLRKAAELDTRNRTIRAALLNALLDYGRTLLGKDWQSAKPLIQEALQLEENNPVARSLFAQVQDHERQAQVDTCVWDARDLQAAGDLQGALLKVRAMLRKYPNDMRLSQLETTLLNSIHAEPRQSQQSPKTPSPTPKRNRLSPAASAEVHDDNSVENVAIPAQPDRRDVHPVPVGMPAEASAPLTVLTAQPGNTQPKPAAVLPIVGKKRQWAAFILLPVLIIAVLGAVYLVRRARLTAKPKVQGIPVELKANIEGVKFTIDGRPATPGAVSLDAGKEYVVEASHDGYQTDTRRFTPNASASQIVFVLSALLPEVRFSSDLKNGQVSIGDQQSVSLQSGEFGPEQLPSGSTSLKVSRGGRLLLELPLTIESGKAPTLSGSMQAKDCTVVVVSILGNAARVYASPDLKGNSGQLPPQTIPADGLAVDTSTAGQEFTLSDGRSLAIEPSNAPALVVSLSTGSASGTLRIEANVPQAQVKIDGKLRKNPMSNGSKTVLLETGKHKIQVIAPRYQDSEEREVNIQERKTTREVFSLVSLQAQLSLEAAESGATVYIDGEPRGTVPESGSLQLALTPGDHKFGLKKATYEDSPILTREFKPRQTETINGRQLPLLRYGSLIFNVTPTNATVTLLTGNEPARAVRPNEVVFLKKGTYTYTIEADHFATISGTCAVEPNNSTAIGRSLQAAGPQESTDADLFEDPSQWSHRGNWWVLKKSDYAWLKPRNGSFSVIIEKPHSVLFARKKVEWTLDYRSEGNKITYSASGKTLSRQVVAGGSPASSQVKAQFTERPDTYHFIFDISPTRIIVRDNGGNPIDEVKRTDPSLDLGKIGFRGEISITVQQLR